MLLLQFRHLKVTPLMPVTAETQPDSSKNKQQISRKTRVKMLSSMPRAASFRLPHSPRPHQKSPMRLVSELSQAHLPTQV